METGNRVLLVGLPDIVEELKGKLLYRGFTFEGANTGEEALEKARVTRFQTIVLDVDVPEVDGIETARQLMEENPGIRIWLVTSLNRMNDCIDALEIGIQEILLKPVEISELLNLLGASTNL